MSEKATPSEIGARIKLIREASGLTLEQVAKAIGVSPSTVLRYENGSFERVKLTTLLSLSQYFGVSADFLSCKDDCDPEDLQLFISDISKKKENEPAVLDGKPLDEQDLKLLRLLRTMTPEEKDWLLDRIDAFLTLR